MKKVTFLLFPLFVASNGLAQPTVVWQNWFDYNGGSDFPSQVRIDQDDNIFVLGTSDVDTFNNDIMIIKINAEGVTEWHNLIRNDLDDVPIGIEVDNNGNCFVGGNLGDPSLENRGFISRYNADGTQIWVDTPSTTISSLCIDKTDNLYGKFGDKNIRVIKYNISGETLLDFTNDTITTLNTPSLRVIQTDSDGNIYVVGDYSSNGGDICVMLKKFSSEGLLFWEVKYNPTEDEEHFRFMELDDLGNIYIAGWIGSYDGIILVKFNSEGELVWDDKIYDGSGLPYDLKLDSDGHPVICGKVFEVHNVTEYILRKYDHFGNVVWTDYIDSAGSAYDKIAHLTSDTNGNIYFAATMWPVTLSLPSFLMCMYDENGIKLWEYRADSLLSLGDFVTAIVLDPLGNIIVSMRSNVVDSKTDFLTMKFSLVTGMGEMPIHRTLLNVLPNPFHADAVVTTSNYSLLNQASTITIIDLYGRTMKSASYCNNYQLDRAGIPSGVYLVKVVAASGVSAIAKIIIL